MRREMKRGREDGNARKRELIFLSAISRPRFSSVPPSIPSHYRLGIYVVAQRTAAQAGCCAMRFPHRCRSSSSARDGTWGTSVVPRVVARRRSEGVRGGPNGEYRRGFSMESKEESCRTEPTILPRTYEAGYTDRRDVVRRDIPPRVTALWPIFR